MEKLKPCPWCKSTIDIVPCDDEGNIHRESGYENDPWSGLGYLLVHELPYDVECPIATHPGDDSPLGRNIYDSKEAAIKAWNKHAI